MMKSMNASLVIGLAEEKDTANLMDPKNVPLGSMMLAVNARNVMIIMDAQDVRMEQQMAVSDAKMV